MAEHICGTVAEITRYGAKGEAGTPLQSATLLQDLGMEGDMYAIGGDRQLTLLSLDAARWMRAQTEPGLCFTRFKANLILDGMPMERLCAGDGLRAGEASLEISAASKRCHPECKLFAEGRPCMLSQNALFAKVTRGGRVRTGDAVAREEPVEPVFSHFDDGGNAVMVDVSGKAETQRVAVAKGVITMNERTLAAIRGKTASKGDVLGVARVAGIMAAKKTAGLIPLCHTLTLNSCAVDFSTMDGPPRVEAACTVSVTGRTGAEMEALTGVTVALLTIYDMCKALDRSMEIGSVRLWEKSGGKSGRFTRAGADGQD